MNALSYFILAMAKILHLLLNLYTFVVAIAVLLSWVNPDPYNPLVRIFRHLTEPAFHWARRWMPRVLLRTGVDLSPMVILFILIILDTVVVELLYDWAYSLK